MGLFLSCSFVAHFRDNFDYLRAHVCHFAICASRYASVCACMLQQREEDKWSFCLLSRGVYQMCWFAKWKTKTVYQCFVSCDCLADRRQLLLDISGGLTGTRRLKTSGLLLPGAPWASLTQWRILTHRSVSVILLLRYNLVFYVLNISAVYNLLPVKCLCFTLLSRPLQTYIILPSPFIFPSLFPSCTVSCDVMTGPCWNTWSSC